jgi:hypothetical protein
MQCKRHLHAADVVRQTLADPGVKIVVDHQKQWAPLVVSDPVGALCANDKGSSVPDPTDELTFTSILGAVCVHGPTQRRKSAVAVCIDSRQAGIEPPSAHRAECQDTGSPDVDFSSLPGLGRMYDRHGALIGDSRAKGKENPGRGADAKKLDGPHALPDTKRKNSSAPRQHD